MFSLQEKNRSSNDISMSVCSLDPIVCFSFFIVCFSSRCGSSFCSEHRYPEAHACAFDYKAEGKRLIERNNPLITAPKLPKIWAIQTCFSLSPSFILYLFNLIRTLLSICLFASIRTVEFSSYGLISHTIYTDFLYKKKRPNQHNSNWIACLFFSFLIPIQIQMKTILEDLMGNEYFQVDSFEQGISDQITFDIRPNPTIEYFRNDLHWHWQAC